MPFICGPPQPQILRVASLTISSNELRQKPRHRSAMPWQRWLKIPLENVANHTRYDRKSTPPINSNTLLGPLDQPEIGE